MDDDLDYLSPSFGKKQKERQVPPTAAVLPASVMQAESSTPADEDLTYLSGGKPPPDYTKIIENAKREANLLSGGELGAIAGIAGPIARGVGSFVEDKGADLLAKALSRVPGMVDKVKEGLTPGGKWGSKTGYGVGEGTTQEVSSRYQRKVSKGKISGKLDKRYGPKLPGEPDSLIDRLLLRNANAEAAAREAVMVEKANKPSFAKAVSAAGKNVGTLAGSAAFGALHGMNAADQAQQAMDTWGTNKAEATGHALSGLGSATDLASNFMPELWRQGVRKYISPLAMLGAGAADVAKGYKEATEPAQATETPYDYQKRLMTGQLRMPSAIARTGLGLVNPIAGFASMLPPFSPEYAVQNPEQVRKWIEAGAYDTVDEQLDKAKGVLPPLSLYEKRIGAGRGLVNP
jgi:hypothetical protein